MPEVTHMLHMARRDQPGAADRLWREVYDELKRMAAARMAVEARPALLQATGLVHEAWMRMSGPAGEMRTWHNRAHFFGAAAEAMRRILVEQARQRLSAKRGGGREAVSLEEAGEIAGPSDQKTLQVHELLDALAQENVGRAELVKLRFFAGLSHTEIGALLGMSERTVRREWTLAKTWLFQSLSEKATDLEGGV
jgi:RNA polymerase sigma factor (TIGR02999 family)